MCETMQGHKREYNRPRVSTSRMLAALVVVCDLFASVEFLDTCSELNKIS